PSGPTTYQKELGKLNSQAKKPRPRRGQKIFYRLSEDTYAIWFPYYQVTHNTINLHLPPALTLRCHREGLVVMFVSETPEEARLRRCDWIKMQEAFPQEIKLLKTMVRDLKEYTLVRLCQPEKAVL
ncbi:MAG TPA: hypothetical protein PKC93_17685, partial [Candidatus Obscuribacter sp.]|nr:hypothetical protein [Candidatus Obscuribacter sp.]